MRQLKVFSACCVLTYCLLVSSSACAEKVDPLNTLIRHALATYPSILSQKLTQEAAQSDVLAAKLKFLPSPTFNTQRNNVRFDGATSTGNMPSTNVTVNQPIWAGGALIAGYNKADARLGAADFALLETREDVAKKIITAYSDWLRSWLKILAFEESLRVHERLVGLINRRFQQGVASGSDRDLGVTRLQQTKADLETVRSAELTSLSTLSELVGKPVQRQDLVQKIAVSTNVPPRKIGLNKALSNSVSIQRAKHEAEAADAEAKEVRAQALPQVSFQAQRQIGNAYYPGVQGFDSYGIVVNYAPGGGLSSIATASAAMDRSRAAAMQVETLKREMTDRLTAEYNEYEFSLLKKSHMLQSALLTGEVSASYDRQYLVGRKSWLDLMNSVREEAQARAELASTEGALVGASHRLMIYIDGTQRFD